LIDILKNYPTLFLKCHSYCDLSIIFLKLNLITKGSQSESEFEFFKDLYEILAEAEWVMLGECRTEILPSKAFRR